MFDWPGAHFSSSLFPKQTKTINTNKKVIITMTKSMTVNTTKTASTKPPLVTPKTPAPKVVVAQSDYDSALQAIDYVMKDEYSSKPSEEESTNNEVEDDETMEEEKDNKNDDENESTTDDASMKVDEKDMDGEKEEDETEEQKQQRQQLKMTRVKDAFLEQVHISLKERLYQIVNPIPDDEFHKRSRGHIMQQQIEEEQEEEEFLVAQEEAERVAKEDARRYQEEMHSMDCNTDYDEHELLDQDAVKRARELRDQVRSTAADMKQKQDVILTRAIQLAQREVRLVTNDILLEEAQTVSKNTTDNNEGIKRHDARRMLLQQMKVSLQAMLSSVSKMVEGDLPEHLVDLQDTIDTIEKSLTKKQQPGSLSQTEQAILSRTNEGMDYCINGKNDLDGPSTIVEEEDELDDMNNPYLFLADFLGRY